MQTTCMHRKLITVDSHICDQTPKIKSKSFAPWAVNFTI